MTVPWWPRLHTATIWCCTGRKEFWGRIITISLRAIQLKLGLQLNWNRLKRKWIQLFCGVPRNTGNERSGIKYRGVNPFESICDASAGVRSMPQCHSPALVEPESFARPPLIHVETLRLCSGMGRRREENNRTLTPTATWCHKINTGLNKANLCYDLTAVEYMICSWSTNFPSCTLTNPPLQPAVRIS